MFLMSQKSVFPNSKTIVGQSTPKEIDPLLSLSVNSVKVTFMKRLIYDLTFFESFKKYPKNI